MATTKKKGTVISNLFTNIEEMTLNSPSFTARIIRTILRDLGITMAKWGNLVNEWSYCKHSGVRNTTVDRINARSNLVKEVTADQPTWNSVMKFFKVIRCVRFRVNFHLEFTWRKPLDLEFNVENLPLRAYKEEIKLKPELTKVDTSVKDEN